MTLGIHDPTPLKMILLWTALALEGIIAVVEIAIVYRIAL